MLYFVELGDYGHDLAADLLVLPTDVLKHLHGDFRQLRTTKTKADFNSGLRSCKCVCFARGCIVQSAHQRGDPGRKGLPVPCQSPSSYGL